MTDESPATVLVVEDDPGVADLVTKSRTPARSARITVPSSLNPVTRTTGGSIPSARSRA